MVKKILVIEDNLVDQILIKRSLSEIGKIRVVAEPNQAMELLHDELFHLIVMDIHLPEGNGLEIGKGLKKTINYKTPFIYLTSSDCDSSLVQAFNIGAEDFVKKPFRPSELQARVQARLGAQSHEVLTFAGIEMNIKTQRVFVVRDKGRVPIDLTHKEFQILYLLINDPDRVFSRKSILDMIWQDKVYVSDRVIDTHLSKLRKKLGDGHQCSIQSIYGLGYKVVKQEKVGAA